MLRGVKRRIDWLWERPRSRRGDTVTRDAANREPPVVTVIYAIY
jgi:hypothetical protein